MFVCDDLETTEKRSDSIDSAPQPTTIFHSNPQLLQSIREEETDLENGFIDSKYDEEIFEQKELPRMHVLIALTCTLGWIFFCAALFRFWEEWTYAESCYFMFIRYYFYVFEQCFHGKNLTSFDL